MSDQTLKKKIWPNLKTEKFTKLNKRKIVTKQNKMWPNSIFFIVIKLNHKKKCDKLPIKNCDPKKNVTKLNKKIDQTKKKLQPN